MTITEDDLRGKDPGVGALDGAGIVSSANDLIHSKGLADGLLNAYSAKLSAVGVIKDPFEAALSAGVGWAIEHVGFLRESLNALAGDPNAIQAHAQTWQKIAQQLGASAAQRVSGPEALTSWQGGAHDAYQAAATQQADKILQSALAADDLSREVLLAGAAVGTVRSLIRDMIAKFIAKVVERLLLALAGAVETLGATVAAFIADMVAEGVVLAGDIAGKISELLKALARSSSTVTALAGKVDGLAQGLGKVGQVAGAELPGVARNGVHATFDQGRSMLGKDMQRWAADPPEGVLNVVKGAVTESKDDVVKNLHQGQEFWRDKAGVQVLKQGTKIVDTEAEWKPL